MKTISYIIYFLQIATLVAATTRWTEEDRLQESQQIDYWSAKVIASSSWGDQEKLQEFTLGLESISYRSHMDGHNPEVDKIYKQMQEMMTSIPDHAKYFTDKIEETYESHAKVVRKIVYPPDWDTRVQKMVETRGFESYQDWLRGQWGDCEEINSKCIGMLGHIPSTESVKALGRYLRERDEPDIRIERPRTGSLAAESLTELISDGPVRIWMASYEDVLKCQKWFDEVKAGKRTFRFVGSDVAYTLDGPADAVTLKRIKERNSNTQRPNEKREHIRTSDVPVGTNQREPLFHIVLLAAILLCVAALTYIIKRR